MTVLSRNVDPEVLDALGLTGRSISEIHIHFVVNDIVKIEIVELPSEDHVDKLLPIFKQYKLMELNENQE